MNRLFEQELKSYLEDKVEICPGYLFSQYKLVKRIALYANGVYPKGKIDSQGNYKYWCDVSSPRIDNEIKNIDFDTKDIFFYSDFHTDALPVFLANVSLQDYLREHGMAEELNDTVEEISGWGNVVWKRVENGYERWDAKNFFVINQTAKTLKDSPVIERHILSQSDLRKKKGIWKNVDEAIETRGNKFFSTFQDGQAINMEIPSYEVYERNGEISEKDLFEAQGKEGGDSEKYILAKVIFCGDINLFAEEIDEPYIECHRGRYTGRWWRLGIYELLMDIQTRANEISNQIARGLEWSSKTVFQTNDRLIAQNILTDMDNGDVIKTTGLSQVSTRMEGMDQLIADWNRLMNLADKLCSSYEVVRGETMPAGTPFRLGFMLNQNVNKLFDFIREKLGISIGKLVDEWIKPDLLKELKAKKILKLTGDSRHLKEFYKFAVNSWYVRNLIALPPHSPEEGEILKAKKLEEIQAKPEHLIELEKGLFDDVKIRVKVVISGENVNLQQELETLSTFINLESDPVRRTALIEMAMAKKNIDISTLPKSTPEQLAGKAGMAATPKEAELPTRLLPT